MRISDWSSDVCSSDLAQELKTPDAREAVNPGNLVCRAVRAVKHALPDIGIVCDVALDPYNSDGHDGLLRDGRILNDETVEVLCDQALVQARAVRDVIAPSAILDGRAGAISRALAGAGLREGQAGAKPANSQGEGK